MDADFLRFYGIDLSQTGAVGSARFFKLLYRLPLYEGAITARANEEREKQKKHSPAKALRSNTGATVTDDVASISEFIDHKN